MEPQTPKTPEPTPSQGGVPIWTALVILVVLAIVIIAGLGVGFYYIRSSDKKAERAEARQKAAEAENRAAAAKAEEATKLTIARNRQEDLLRVIRKSTNELGSLLVTVTQLGKDMESLKTDRVGTSIAAFPDLVAQARRFYDEDSKSIATSSEVTERLEGSRRVEQQILEAAGTAFEPDAGLVSSTEDTLSWAQSQRRLAEQGAALLSSLKRDAKAKLPLQNAGDPQTLEVAMSTSVADEIRERNAAIFAKTKGARAAANNALAQAEADRIAAEAQAKKTDTDLQAKQVLDESQKKILREKASRPDIQSQLSELFIHTLYWL